MDEKGEIKDKVKFMIEKGEIQRYLERIEGEGGC